MPPLLKYRLRSVAQRHSVTLETQSLKSGSAPLSPIPPAPIQTATCTPGPAPPATPGLAIPRIHTPLTDTTCSPMSTPASEPPAPTGVVPTPRGAGAATATRAVTTLLRIKPTTAIHSTRAITTTITTLSLSLNLSLSLSREETTTAIPTREATTTHNREAATFPPEEDTPTIITRRIVMHRSGLLNTRATPESRRRRITQGSAHFTGRMTINGEYWSSGGEAKGA